MVKRFLVRVLLAIPMGAHAASGNDLLGWCESPAGSAGERACIGYIAGFRTGYELRASSELDCSVFETPEEVTNTQTMRVVVKWMQENPEQLHSSIEFVMLQSLSGIFPCD